MMLAGCRSSTGKVCCADRSKRSCGASPFSEANAFHASESGCLPSPASETDAWAELLFRIRLEVEEEVEAAAEGSWSWKEGRMGRSFQDLNTQVNIANRWK